MADHPDSSAAERAEPLPSPYKVRGQAVVADMFGTEFLDKLSAIAGSSQFGAANAALAIEFAFGAVWARDGLSRQQRSLVTLGLLIGSGRFAELKNHVRAGIRHGLGVPELQEVLVQAVPYCGFPAAAEATQVVFACLREEGLLDSGHASAAERGLI